ncbi:agamous-like MADS-box protein AGL62 [Tanacetum coccineum]
MVIVNNMNKKTAKKSVELCVLTGAKIAIIVNSLGGRVFAFGHPNIDALINAYLANEKNVDVDVDALQTNEFKEYYAEVQRELELEKKRKDIKQGPNVLQHVQGQRLNAMQRLQGPNVPSSHGPNVFDNAWKYYNGQYFFDPASTMNASLQDQGGSNYNLGVGGELRKF